MVALLLTGFHSLPSKTIPRFQPAKTTRDPFFPLPSTSGSNNLHLEAQQPLTGVGPSPTPKETTSKHYTNSRLTVPRENADVNDFVSTRITLATPYPQVGKPLQIDCYVTGSSGVRVTWHKDDQLLSSSNRVKIMSNHTLLISRAENQDSGNYECSAEYQGSQSSSSIYVHINNNRPLSADLDQVQGRPPSMCHPRDCRNRCPGGKGTCRWGYCECD
ncbi:hypothetical protein TNIN_447821 [Trichonephila inaurata madagascariensis]|uniref:Ig-like domain-containing protein n=1 Tax=Trichonephila inaurata madagascariensis TaxID=2747483 RepID=A0A8X6J9A6_9ARAC|nr:hypothetical protein TNIN_447821 [Trichonephila inaurata madagascariensis]